MNRYTYIRLLRSTGIFVFAMIAAPLMQAQTFLVTDLGNSFRAWDVNNSGTVVGNGALVAKSVSNGVGTDLGTLGGPFSTAKSINDSGVIVGDSYNASNQTNAYLYSNGTMTNLGTLGGTFSSAYSINNSGVVVGVASTTGLTAQRAFSYSGGVMTNLGTLGGTSSAAHGINNSGTIVGTAKDGTFNFDRAFSYSGGVMTDLGTLGGFTARAQGINNLGLIVGYSSTDTGQHAFSYTNGAMNDLGTLGGSNSYGLAVNDDGWIVGYSQITGNTENRAFLYRNGQLLDLNSLIGSIGTTLVQADSINNLGQIVAYGANGRSYLISAIPEPSTYAAIAGAVMLGLAVWRRRVGVRRG